MISCAGGNSQEPAETTTVEKKTNSKNKSCLSDITDPGKWYSISQAAAITSEPEANIEASPNEKYQQIQFNWKNDRKHTMKIGNTSMEIPTNNMIAITIKNLDDGIEKATKRHKNRTFTYGEYFDSYHTQATKEEQKVIDEMIDKEGEENEDFDAKTTKKLLALAPTEGFSDITDLGDDANMYVQMAPGLRETRLAVLHGNVAILVNVDISDDDGVDLSAARKIAEAVMALCD
jgi:hypothetical protein